MFGWSCKRSLQLTLLVLGIAAIAFAHATGPDQGYTDAPGDLGNCTACHDNFPANSGPGSLNLSGNPAVYTPGQNYTLAIVLQDSRADRRRWGFQLTAIDGNGNRAGTFTPLGSDTQIASTGTPILDRQYIEHTTIGTFAGTSGGHTWHLQWTAPVTDAGAVHFYFAGNAANNDGTNQGDYIYANSASSDSPTSVVTLTLQTHPDGQTLPAGTVFTIDWSATNTPNVDSYELRYSTDDGATFPITNLIFSTADPSVTGTQWTVPNKPTSLARIRLLAATKSGSVTTVISGRFTIAGGSGGVLPEITGAQAQGKKLFVSGQTFQMGAVVTVNGEPQRTVNEDDFSHQLFCKKAAKFIPFDTPVVLTVVNPDGGTSAAFSFVKSSS
jgi:hypothetical protein